MPSISVIMSTYKENPSLIEESIDSILAQSHRDFALLIVIDCPNNHSIKELLRRKQSEDNRITTIENDHNLGLARSLNKALSMARGDYICRMDADDISTPDRISSQLTYLTSNDLDLVGGRMSIIDESGNEMYEIPQPPMTPDAVGRALRWNNCVPHPTWFGKSAVFSQRYREIPLCEDYDFLLRASLAGFKLGNCDRIVLKYRMTSNSVSRSSLYKQFLYQRFIAKAFKNRKQADRIQAEHYVENLYTDAKAKRYSQANETFNQVLVAISNHSYVKVLHGSLKLVCSSPDYLNKIARLALASIV